MSTSNESRCTVVIGANDVRCNKPAVTTFTSRFGDVFAECELHAAPSTVTMHAKSETATLRYRGELRTVEIVSTTPTRARVRVPLRSGDSKIITVRRDELSAR